MGRRTTHGDTGSYLYELWRGIKKRCTNPNDCNYPYYGARGISYKFKDYFEFREYILSTLGHRPTKKYSLDRYPDINGDYEPGNLRWATRSQQVRNCRLRKEKTSKYRGVRWYRGKRWRADINYNGNQVFLGYFDTEEVASSVYLAEYFKIHGELPPEIEERD